MKFNVASLQRYFSPQAFKDMDVFIRELPERAGQTVLIAGGVVWMIAAVGTVYATVEADKTATLRADLFKQEALTPMVPEIVNRPVNNNELTAFAEKANPQYPNVSITAKGGKLNVSAGATRNYWQWREATGHIYNGGAGWRLSIDKMCVGRECSQAELDVTFSVNTLQVVPAKKPSES